MIVYDHYPNGSLERWLFGIGALPWTWRLKLVKDIAQGLSFLHSKQLAHGNLKASSVFLDVNYRPVLGDYGLDFFLPGSGRGSKGDVFGFGMLVLETVAGRKEEGLLGFAREMFEKGEIGKVVDERMGDRVNSEEAVRILKIGLSCTASESGRRPCMEEVVQCLASSSHSRPIVL
ncbi:L-type lectin-domain containing receptor kinase VIII.2-like [Prunus yedoensis var. nudiflora]|uniref:L-type lectin-domain containing receptor kinase VIII.2-like n=1 Tax=Prunus yedoensis var. nudiflora TaxID=2094558 RepID=A0A314Z562_PRUYE|nr:L-type lectin-domain containing receptor kinase VIII.2-like [Prunus yedoensis var. nudiflora]